MRPGVLLRRTARIRKRYACALKAAPLNNAEISERLSSIFGQYVHQLPPSLRAELLRPDLQCWPQRHSLFANLGEKGRMVLGILLNDHLGTKNIELSPRVLAQFCEMHHLDAAMLAQEDSSTESDSVNLLLECVGAIDTFVGNTQCREMVRRNILDGATGISNLYLEALSNNEL